MKHWSKILFVFMAMVMVFGAVGCQSKAAEPTGPITIRVLGMQQAGYPVETMQEIADKYMAENPNVKLELEFVAYEALHDKISTSMATTPPAYDVMLIDDIWYAEFSNAGYLYDVTDKITEEMKTGIFPSGWEITTVQSKVYGLPFGIDGKYFYYNEKLLKEAGFDAPPKTWEEMDEMSKVIKEKGIVEYPMVWSWAQAETAVCDLVTLLYGNGGAFVDDAGNPTFNNQAGVEVVDWMVKTLDEGTTNPASVSYLEEDVRNVFSQGKAVFAINWGYMFQLSNFDPAESQVNGQVNMALMPVFQKGLDAGIQTATINGSMGWSVAANSVSKDAAWEFVKYLTSKPVQDQYSNYSTPAWATSYEGENLDKLLAVSDANKVLIPNYVLQIPSAHVRPKVPYYSEASLALQLAIQEAVTRQKTPQEALDGAAAKFAELHEKYK